MPSEDGDLPQKVASDEGGVVPAVDESNSPDDLTDFFPMTTSMTRELRLELESLDRQVNCLRSIVAVTTISSIKLILICIGFWTLTTGW